MHPLDDVVTDIERVRVLGQDLDAVAAGISRGGKGVRPPGGAGHEGVADVLGRAGVDIIDDGLAARLQPVADGEAGADVARQRRGEIIIADRDVGEARIVGLGLVSGLRQAGDEIVHAERDGARVGRHRAHLRAGFGGSEGQFGLDGDIVGEAVDAVETEGGAVLVEGEALVAFLERECEARAVGGEEGCHVDGDAAVLADAFGSAGPEDGSGEGLAHGLLLRRGGANGAVAPVLGLDGDALAANVDADDLVVGAEAAVESERVGAESGGEGGGIERAHRNAVGIGCGQVDEQLALCGIGTEREERRFVGGEGGLRSESADSDGKEQEERGEPRHANDCAKSRHAEPSTGGKGDSLAASRGRSTGRSVHGHVAARLRNSSRVGPAIAGRGTASGL